MAKRTAMGPSRPTTNLLTLANAKSTGCLIRGRWGDVGLNGRQLIGLYPAMAGDLHARPGNCPEELMPRWLAYLLSLAGDHVSWEFWPTLVDYCIILEGRLGALSKTQSRHLDVFARVTMFQVAKKEQYERAALDEHTAFLLNGTSEFQVSKRYLAFHPDVPEGASLLLYQATPGTKVVDSAVAGLMTELVRALETTTTLLS